jgi:CBS domain-containing protein
MNIGQICSREAVTVPESAPLSEVAALMSDCHVGTVVVTRGHTADSPVAGIITDRDIVCAQLERTADLSRLSAGATMTRNPLTLTEDESVDVAVLCLKARGVRRAPVVDGRGALVGLISVDDLLVQLMTKVSGLVGIVARQGLRET